MERDYVKKQRDQLVCETERLGRAVVRIEQKLSKTNKIIKENEKIINNLSSQLRNMQL